jgi:hypothetical protein
VHVRRQGDRITLFPVEPRLLVLGLVVLVLASAGCSTGASRSAPSVRLMSAVQPAPPGCAMTSSCTPVAAQGPALTAVPSGFGSPSAVDVGQPDPDDTIYTRRWQASQPTFLNPGGQPMGAEIDVRVTDHPSEDDATALGLADNPRQLRQVSVGSRDAYASSWTVTATGLDGTSQVTLQAESIYIAVSDTLRVQVDTIGLSPIVAQLVAQAVVVQ